MENINIQSKSSSFLETTMELNRREIDRGHKSGGISVAVSLRDRELLE